MTAPNAHEHSSLVKDDIDEDLSDDARHSPSVVPITGITWPLMKAKLWVCLN